MAVDFYKDRFTEENLKKSGLNERQIKAVIYVKEKRKITNRDYQKEFSVSRQTATRELLQMMQSKIFIRHGKTGRDPCTS